MAEQKIELDAVIVGAGFAGLYALYKLRESGLSVRAYERGADVGGTWYWNRYPGARCDVTSVQYSYSFSPELEQEWTWTEIMAAQPEILDYARYVADKFDLRRDIRFGTTVSSARYDESTRRWLIRTDQGEVLDARYFVMATGSLSTPNTPQFEGIENFQGPVYHTGLWPEDGVDFSGKTVGIIGTGSSGTQAIPVIAEEAAHLTVFQRTPNYTLPANNRPLPPEEMAQVKRDYADIRRTQQEALTAMYGFGGRQDAPPTLLIKETTEADRMRALDEHGFFAVRLYKDVAVDLEANEMACEMYREMVRRTVADPDMAERLLPRGYPLGCKRPVIDTDYYQTFNRDNVTLVDLRRGGINAITATGIDTEQGHFEFDVLVAATGFDAMTGSYLGVDIVGRDQRSLRDAWAEGPRTYLGLQVVGFPNLFLLNAPGSPSVLTNMITSMEFQVEWMAECIAYLDQNQIRSIEAIEAAQEAWIAHVNDVAEGTMHTAPSCNSWYLGANIPGKPRIFMPYAGGYPRYKEKCREVAAKGYEGFRLSA